MNKKLACLTLLALSLTACGPAKKSPDDPTKNSQSGGQTGNLSPEDIQSQCSAKGNTELNYGTYINAGICVVTVGRVLFEAEESGTKTLVAAPNGGTAVLSDSHGGFAQILLNKKPLSHVGGLYIIPTSDIKGSLQIDVETPSDSITTAVAYECYNGKMERTGCRPEYISH